ncbi:aspartate--tRNA ligase [bacterium]|nr:aspartate--tRNA ligase [bacterium]
MKRILSSQAEKYLDQTIKVEGWICSKRSHGKLVFIDLRDMEGLIQVVFNPSESKAYEIAKKVKPEWVVEIKGRVSKRPEGMENPKIASGNIELRAEEIKIYSEAKTLPFAIDTDGYEISEEKRLRYRYIDLRRQRMKRNLEIRQRVIYFMRKFLIERGFVEVETPILTKSTPEGARDFLVPSRLHPGKFYALPQSPQQYKQLLMISGIEKYFQIARALRDEDPRADRQVEHTQLDIEMAFTSQEEILNLIETLYIALVKEIFPEKKILQIPFPRITYKEAITKYKTDKPDIRENKEDDQELAFAFITDFPMFEWHEKEKRWGAMHHPFTKPQTEDIEKIKKYPEKILAHQYDFVLNGYEIGGGSIRTTNLDVLLAVFEVLGHKKEEIKKNFAHYFEAFSFGVPPHGGIAAGIERFLAITLNEPSIREVIAFPKTGDGRDLMMNIPSEVTKKQLKELHIRIESKNK